MTAAKQERPWDPRHALTDCKRYVVVDVDVEHRVFWLIEVGSKRRVMFDELEAEGVTIVYRRLSEALPRRSG